MARTKIINVQKNDSFDDVFEAFQSAEAREIIFIFPKGSPFGKQASYFDSLQEEAKSTGKTINVMTADPVVTHLALQQGWGVLQNPTPRPRRVVTPTPLAIDTEPASDVEQIESTEIEYPVAELTAVRKSRVIASDPADTSHRIRDIRIAKTEHPVPVREVSGENIPLTINSEVPVHDVAPEPIHESVSEHPEHVVVEPPHPIDPMPMHEFVEPEQVPQEAVHPQVAPQVAPQIVPQAPLSSFPMSSDIERLWAQEEKRQGSKPSAPAGIPRYKRRISKTVWLTTLGIFILLGGGVYAFFMLGSAKIIIAPQQQELNFKLKLTASTTAEKIQADFNLIPGQVFSAKKSVSGEFPVTAEKDVAQKAYGTIKITNKGTTAQKLVATTRFESKDGLIFRVPETITVPASGNLLTRVYADQPGKEYNIGPTTFTIPGFKGTPNFDNFSAVSSESMGGGLVGAGKVVSEQVFVKAQEELMSKLKDEIMVSMKSQAGDLKILEPITVVADTPITNAKVGDAAEKLTMTLSGSAKAIAYRGDDTLTLIDAYLAKSGDLKLSKKDLDITYTLGPTNTSSTSFPFEAAVKGYASATIDTDAIRQAIPGMNETDVRAYFKGITEISSARVILSPPWVTNVPKDPKKITITVGE